MKRRILVGLMVMVGAGVAGVSVEGTWRGTLRGPGFELPLVFHLEQGDDGNWTAALDSPDQGAFGLRAEAATWDGERLRLDFPALGAWYSALWNQERQTLRGSWEQGGQAYALELGRGEAAGSDRPQLPQPPFPYSAEDATFRNEEEGFTLAGTFTVPEGEGPFPAAILVSGSGPQDRDETIFGHKPFLVLADHLTRAGVAVLRYDDRGVGESGGVRETATTPDLARDAAAAFAWLRERPEVDPARVGIVGHSEGGLIGPLVAAQDDAVAFLVLLAGPAVSGREILLAQARFMLEREPLGAAVVPDVLPWLRRLYAVPADSVEPVLKAARAALGETTAEIAGIGLSTHAETVRTLTLPWTRWFLDQDPAPALASLDIPVLALFGAKDFQVPPDVNAPPMRAALRHPASRVEILPDLNHLFQTAETGAMTEYAGIEETFSPAALEAITAWIRHR